MVIKKPFTFNNLLLELSKQAISRTEPCEKLVEELINFDFKREIFNLRKLPYNNQNYILNFIIYKGNIYGADSDCDRLPITLDLYSKLWSNTFRFWDTNQTNFIYANGETMNSFVKSYKVVNANNYDFSKELFNEYAKLTHTLGNFIPVYAINIKKNEWKSPFNTKRQSATYDYWDLTLYHIKSFFQFEKEKILEKEWILTKSYIVESREWLLSFNTWSNFVEKNFLQSFLVDPNDIESDPIEFWKGHFNLNEPVNAQNSDQINEFLEKVNWAIKERSRNMIKALFNVFKNQNKP